MTVKLAQTYLLTSSDKRLKEIISELIEQEISFEALDPRSLGEEWNKVLSLQEEYKNYDEEINLLDSVLTFYKPKGLFAGFWDNRIEVKKDFLNKALEDKESILTFAKETLEENQKSKKHRREISEKEYYQMVSLHAALEMEKKITDISRYIFQVKQDSELAFIFLGIEEGNAEKAEKLIKKNEIKLEKIDWQTEIVTWENSGGLKSFQGILQALGTINTKEADPTLAVTIFFMTFFAFSLGDALYGLFMAIITGYLYLNPKLKPNLKSSIGLFFYSSLATLLYGLLINSWGGDLIAKIGFLNSILSNFQIIDILNQESDAPINLVLNNLGVSPIVFMMVVSALIGFTQILVAYLFKTVNHFREGNTIAAAGDINWIVFIFSIGFTLGTGDSLRLVFLAILAASAIGLFVLNGGKGILGKIISGFGQLYGLIGLFSDLISYTRLVAVGLTGSIIAVVINILAMLIIDSGSIIGLIAGIIFLILGHLFNLGVTLFGAYINPLRLHYVEFIPKFFEGKGRKLEPVSLEFKHLRLENKTQ
jgi:V/A-type H+/Na+-transporting ATPase subunit I